MGSSSPVNPTPLMELRPSNGIGREMVRDIGIRERDRDNSRYPKERERERDYDRERENQSQQGGPGPPLVLERMPAPREREREREREYERDIRERPAVHHAQTLPTPLRRSPLSGPVPSTSKSNSRSSSPKLQYPYPNGHPNHPHDAQRRHTVPFPPTNPTPSASLARQPQHSSAEPSDHHIPVSSRAVPHLPPSTSHPTSYSRHQPPPHHQRPSQSHMREDDVAMVSPVSPVPGGSGVLPFGPPRSARPSSRPSQPSSSGMRRLSGAGSSGSGTLHGSTVAGSASGRSQGTGATVTSPILVSPTESIEDGQRSSVLGQREREREPDSRRDSITSTGASLARSRSGSGSTSRPASVGVVLAPHLVRGGGSTHASPRMHSSSTQPPPQSSPYSHSQQYVQPPHPSHTSPQPPPGLPQPTPGTVYTLPAPGSVPPGSVVYVYGFPPPGQPQPSPIVQPSQPQPPTMTSGGHSSPLPLPSHSHHALMQPQPPPHSPISTRAPAPISAPPQAGHPHHPQPQSQGQPVTRRQTYPQQLQSHPTQVQVQSHPPPPSQPQAHPHHPQSHQGHSQAPQQQAHSHSSPQQHHHSQHPQPHHQHSYPPVGKSLPHSPNLKHHVVASSPTVAHLPSSSSSSHSHHQQSQLQTHGPTHAHSQGHHGPQSHSQSQTQPSSNSQHHHHHHQQHQQHHHSGSSSSTSGGGGGGGIASASGNSGGGGGSTSSSTVAVNPQATATIQRILNTAYADLLGVVDKETTVAVHSYEKERARREKLERALEERERMLKLKDEQAVSLSQALRVAATVPAANGGGGGSSNAAVDSEKEKEMSKLQSEITHLKAELMGLKDDKDEMQEEIDELTEKLAAAGEDGGSQESSRQLAKEVEELRIMEKSRMAEITLLKEQVDRWREEARVWREEKAQLSSLLDERDKEVRSLIEQRKQLDHNSSNPEQAVSMITASPTDPITASPLPFTVPLSSPSPRPSSQHSNFDTNPHHSQSILAPPIMGSLNPQSPQNQTLSTNGNGRPGSRHDVGDDRRHHQLQRSQPHQRPHLSLPVHLGDDRSSSSSRPPSAVSPHASMSLPLPTPERPSSRPSSAHLSPKQLLIPLPVPFASNTTTSRPSSRPSLNGIKRSWEDANAEVGHRRERESGASVRDRDRDDVDNAETPSRTEPSPRSLPSPTAQEKAPKVAKRHTEDDAATASASTDSSNVGAVPVPPMFATTKNPYVTHSKPRSKSGSISVEDGVFRHVQHPHSRSIPIPQLHHYQQQQQTSSFWKNVPASASATQAKKDEEPKLSFKHFPLLYQEIGKDYVCRECKTSTTAKRKAFPNTTPLPDLLEHSFQDHEERCKDILKYTSSKLTEELVLLKGGGGVLLGKAAGSGHPGSKGGSAHQRKEKSNSK